MSSLYKILSSYNDIKKRQYFQYICNKTLSKNEQLDILFTNKKTICQQSQYVLRYKKHTLNWIKFKMAKKKKWCKFRHFVVFMLAKPVFRVWVRLKYKIKIKKYKKRGQYLILANHQTGFDQFFCGLAFKNPVYFVASEDLFSNGVLSRILKYVVAPIPIKKQSTDIRAVMNCIQVAREGGSIAIFPEGNRTFSGETVFMNKAIAPLAKKLGLPIAFLRIEGGYGVQPRWSDVCRKGKMKAYVSKVLTPAEYKSMTDAELYQSIQNELYVDEACLSGLFKHKKLAEYLERAIYVCPHCGLSEFESNGNVIECKKCGMKVEYLPTKQLKGINGDFEFEYVKDWYQYQCDFVNKIDTRQYYDKILYQDNATVKEVIIYKDKELIKQDSTITLYGNKISFEEIGGHEFIMPFDEITAITVLGKNKLNIYHCDRLYQIKGDKNFAFSSPDNTFLF